MALYSIKYCIFKFADYSLATVLNFVGTYHKKKYLQLNLNDFFYKLNRRYLGDKIFDRLFIACITASGC